MSEECEREELRAECLPHRISEHKQVVVQFEIFNGLEPAFKVGVGQSPYYLGNSFVKVQRYTEQLHLASL